MTKKVFYSKCLVYPYSTVIGYFTTNTSSPESSSKENVDEILVSFNLVVKSSNLTKSSHYNTYQHKLYRLIKFLKEERGIGYKWISHIMTDKGFRSVRTKSILKPNFIFSIYKKGQMRENRMERKIKSNIENINCFMKYL